MKRFSWVCGLFAGAFLFMTMFGATLVSVPNTTDAATKASPAFQRWVKKFRKRARRSGVSYRTFDRAFRGVKPNPDVIKAANNQPEFARPVWKYLETAVSDVRVEKGRLKYSEWKKTLAKLQKRYGVDKYIILAIWGMESSFGSYKGDHNVIEALATLAYRGRRKKFGRQQLLAALKILQRGDIPPAQMMGSWAGAMGHTQFIPTTYNGYAVDYNGDGRRDIWNTISDALASTGNYLKKSGWRRGEPWGHEVVLPKGFKYSLASKSKRKPLAEWVALGVKRVDGKKFNSWSRSSSIVLPAGAKGPAFIIFKNFRAILRYNNSVAYALAVSKLADRLRGRGGVVGKWPQNDRPLTKGQKRELQKLLVRRGYYRGRIDGRIGNGTAAAIRKYQRRIGVVADGYPGEKLLGRLRRGS